MRRMQIQRNHCFGNDKMILVEKMHLAGMAISGEARKKNYRLGNGKIPQQLFGDYCQEIWASPTSVWRI